jgi:hypothetical protein
MAGRQAAIDDFLKVTGVGAYNLWGELKLLINNKQLIPVISNAVANNYIFDMDQDGQLGLSQGVNRQTEAYQLRLDEQLARRWADFIKYPLADHPLQLAQVAQYNQVTRSSLQQAKTEYLTFLKLYLLGLAGADETVKTVVENFSELMKGLEFPDRVIRLASHSFSKIASELGYPRFTGEQPNPLKLLAELPLPIYITTSHHDFMERALDDVDKKPRMYICSWFGDPHRLEWFGDQPEGVALEAAADERYPLVYHLYGLEKYPASLVISEDDYMDFLVKVSADKEAMPMALRTAIAQASLVLLGYRLRGWDFRALFRGVIKQNRTALLGKSMNLAIQLNPKIPDPDETRPETNDYLKEAQSYLVSYFQPSNFRVEWKTPAQFVQELVKEWRKSL